MYIRQAGACPTQLGAEGQVLEAELIPHTIEQPGSGLSDLADRNLRIHGQSRFGLGVGFLHGTREPPEVGKMVDIFFPFDRIEILLARIKQCVDSVE